MQFCPSARRSSSPAALHTRHLTTQINQEGTRDTADRRHPGRLRLIRVALPAEGAGVQPVATGLALVLSTATIVLISTLGTRRLLARFSIKAVLLAGLACMGAGQLWFAQITAGASYPARLTMRGGGSIAAALPHPAQSTFNQRLPPARQTRLGYRQDHALVA